MSTRKDTTTREKEQKSRGGGNLPVKTKHIARVTPHTKQEKAPFYIAGIGASAGGLEAFEQFFSNMPQDSGIAFILIPHLDPTHISILPDLIQKYTQMNVLMVKDGMEVQPNSVYVIPPKKDMAILHGTLQLIEITGTVVPRLPIDYFLRSLAEDQGERAVGIILSGMGTDGTLGIRAIKGNMGMVMVQNLDSAKYDSMPKSAIETGLVDYILPPQEMPEHLLKYATHASHKTVSKITLVEGKLPDALQKVFILLRSHTGHDFSAYKQNTICRRIERRMNVHQIDSISNYVRYLQENPFEIENLFKELLIGVTNFFRDDQAFEVLEQKALMDLLKSKPNNSSIRVWVPGCSSGEEAYSIAIILQECMNELKRNFKVQIFGTDIDNDAINIARTGIYPGSISTDVNPERLRQFFTRENNNYRLKKEIREMLIFAPQDIIKDPPFTKLDMICCRNLLIYLDSTLQKKLIPLFHYSLKSNGILFLGSSETIGEFVDLFSTVDKKHRIFYRKESTSALSAIVEFPFTPPIDRDDQPQIAKSKELSISQLAEKILLESYVPPSVIINEKGDILYIHGRIGKYLELPPGRPTINILEMTREGLKLELPVAIRRANTQKQEVIYEGLRVKDNGGFRNVNLTVKPVRKTESTDGLILVVFEDVTSIVKEESIELQHPASKKSDKRLTELERELQHTKENLQTTIEELETSNEELKSTNEELQSTNEELQSANEELETSKEEQQSLNEELVTVNTELQGKIDELSKTNNDMKNLLDSIEIPTIFLDNDLHIKRFTSHVDKIINLINTDVGRPINHIVSNLKYENFLHDAKKVLKTLVYRETEVETKEGRWYLMRIMPYRTIDNVIDGVAITFLDIHERKMASEKLHQAIQSLEEARAYAENIIGTVREPLIVLNQDCHVISANRSFYKTFQVKPNETEGYPIYDLGNRQWDIPRLRELLKKIVSENSIFEDFEVDHEFPDIGYKKMILNARQIFHEKGGAKMILMAFEDVTKGRAGTIG